MNLVQTTLHISGMTCNNCTRFVDNTLRYLEGVVSTSLSLEKGTAEVQYDTEIVDLQQIVDAINDTHYSVEQVEQ